MPAHPRVRPFHPLKAHRSALLVALLAALLFTAPSCSSPTHAHVADGSPVAGAALQPGPTGAEGHPHPGHGHGFACSASDPAPAARPGTPQPAGAARPQAVPGPVTASGQARAPGTAGPARARSARSTLAVVCRWRL
ncbi:hypothetical protein GCM10010302_25990 [Streptomyces polychromogenes]|uniref:Lipoprotein n=1 Tax=Streptomyces polychromogenes TaxID=67342 RepID=A0ABP3F015_9ACTN